jgi:hypothetical protein
LAASRALGSGMILSMIWVIGPRSESSSAMIGSPKSYGITKMVRVGKLVLLTQAPKLQQRSAGSAQSRKRGVRSRR